MANKKALFSSNTDQWSTPQEFFDEINKEFCFTLDPCADKQNHKCTNYFTKEQDGLKQDWGGITYFATHHTEEKYINGFKSATKREQKKTRSLSCLFRQEQTQSIFTIL